MRGGKLVAVAAALVLAACQGEVQAPTAVERPPPAVAMRGVDLANDASDVLNELQTSRLNFVARYYRHPTSRWPALSRGEAQRLSSLGVNIVALWEWHSADPAYFSYGSGYADAVMASDQARRVGQPKDTAIYFAVDFNARGPALDAVRQYFRGVAAGLAAAGGGRPLYRAGVYGSGAVCDAVKRSGLAQYSWLSNSSAWSGSLGYNAWNIRQSGRFPSLSFSHDADEAKDDYGGFRITAAASAAPTARPPDTVQAAAR
ncbi:MAG TPA: glycoside hydrolase domain-containing protein [Stellaceae bacterium]|nr:glycoside hydrolase domain-containing protein [Stellaceae bacterium]